MEVRSKSYTYKVAVEWKGQKKGLAAVEGKPGIEVATPPEFKGHPGIWSPEDFFVAAVNSCVMTTFIAFAERAGLSFTAYASEAEGKLELVDGGFRFTEIFVRPHLALASADDRQKAAEVLAKAEANCLISNSITAKVHLEAEIS
ncbi:MAG TPA: OsmC family protein [Rectinemataceae bacterium]|nr:OsmC family protein [Rectinemataceae bacterium]